MKKLLLFASLLALLAGCSKSNEPTNGVKDICGNTYPIVTIGTQTWMAENIRCEKYDTESEAYKEGRYNVPIALESYLYTPSYTNASDKSNWVSIEYAGNLTDTQVAKLGYLYNWAAVVGIADGSKQTASFTGNRQGICPNGWHVPTDDEWNILFSNIGGIYIAGRKIKTQYGWYSGKSCKPGTNDYGFSALPSGYAYGNNVYGPGYDAHFWTATATRDEAAIENIIESESDEISNNQPIKSTEQSVRCVKN